MRATLARFMVSTLAVLAALSMAPAAQASPSIVVYWGGAHAPGLNADCPKGTLKQVIGRLKVQEGERIVAFDNLKVHMTSGKDFYGDGYRVSGRLIEFYVYAPRRANVDLAHVRKTYAYPVEVTDGAEPKLRLIGTCVSMDL